MKGEPVSSGYTGIPTEMFMKRVSRLKEKVVDAGLDGVFVFSDEYRPGNTVYLSDYRPINMIEESPEGVYVAPGQETVLFLGAINAQAARKVSWIDDVRAMEELHPFFNHLVGANNSGMLRVGLIGDELLPVHYYRKLIEPLTDAGLVSADELLIELRKIKDQHEISRMHEAARLGDLAIQAAIDRLKEGEATELDLCASAEYVIRSNGGEVGSATVLSSGNNTEAPTWRPTNKVIGLGEAVLIDVSPSFRGYCTDVAVTIFNGKPAGVKAKVLDFSREVVLNLVERLKPGQPASFIYDCFLEKVQATGYADYFVPYAKGLRAVGHSVGLDVVERPNLDSDSAFLLEPGMTLGVKFDLHGFDFGGLRMEIVVVMEENGCRPLNEAVEQVQQHYKDW
jgi:Xaa-Pro dipeptidase